MVPKSFTAFGPINQTDYAGGSVLNKLFRGFLLVCTLGIGAYSQTVDPNWIQATGSAPFPSRLNAATLVFKNKLWVIGGKNYEGSALQDVWSSPDGKTWERVTDAAACLPRQSHTALVYKDKLWVIAGNKPKDTPVYYSRSDVWNSPDGITWTKVTDSAAFVPRANHASVVFGGKMWVLGGTDMRGTAKDYGDAWSSEDGITWTLANSAAFAPRGFLKAVSYQNKLWVLGGISRNGVLRDIVSSSDGASWVPVTGVSGFNPSDHFFLATVFNEKVWIHDQFQVSNTSDMVSWSNVTRTAPFARLGLMEMNTKLWVIGSLTKGTTVSHEVWYYPPPQLQKRASTR